MTASALFAFLHHAAAFALVAVVMVELVLMRGELTLASARTLLRMDSVYGLCAVVLFPLAHAFWTSLMRIRGLSATSRRKPPLDTSRMVTGVSTPSELISTAGRRRSTRGARLLKPSTRAIGPNPPGFNAPNMDQECNVAPWLY